MKFNALSEDEIVALKPILPAGVYPFELSVAEEVRAKKNPEKEMIKATLKIWGEGGKEFYINDYFTADDKMIWKLKSYFESVGHPQIYESEEVRAESFTNTKGLVRTKIKTDSYGTKAVVASYVKEKKIDAPTPSETVDDDIPF